MAQVEEQVLRSADAVPVEPGCFTPVDHDEDWHAQIRWLRVDGVRVDYLKVSPNRYHVPGYAHRAAGVAQLMLVLVLEGDIAGTVDGQQVKVQRGDGVLIDARAELLFRTDRPMRAVRILVDEDHLPSIALNAQSLPFARLKDSPLVNGCIGLVSGLLQLHNSEVQQHDEVAVSQPLIALVASLLNEALHDEAVGVGRLSTAAVNRRTVIDNYIDLHLTSPDLSPTTIAVALGVHVRTVHASFEESDETAAAYIRRLRIQKAQALLALRTEPPVLKVLAARVGLQPDPFARSFKSVTGMNPISWWRQHGAHNQFGSHQ